MKNLLLLFFSIWIFFSCSDKEEITQPIHPDIDDVVEIKDSVVYQLNVEGFELIAASKDASSLFLRADTTFAFSCLFDSCGTNRLVAYCDSMGVVERIVVDEQVINILYHEDKKKIDIFCKDSTNNIVWINNIENPYKNISSRVESGDVPFSAISVLNSISYAVYTIINTHEVYMLNKAWNYIKKYSAPPYPDSTVMELIRNTLGYEYKSLLANYNSTIIKVMSDYSDWVKKELYGDAIPHLRTYATRLSLNGLILSAYVTEVDSLKSEFKVGVLAAEEGDEITSRKNLANQGSKYNPESMHTICSFSKLDIGKKYKFKPYLAPVSTSKYLTGMKCLLDYYRYGSSKEYQLLETKAQLISQEDDNATIKLSVENAKTSIKMGIIYSENSEVLSHEYKTFEFSKTPFLDDFEENIKLEKLKSGYTYYIPYIIYDDNVINRQLYFTDSFISAVITDEDKIFYGKKDSIANINEPITGNAVLNKNVLTFKGSFDTEIEKIEKITEYGIIYHTQNDSEIFLENSSVLNASTHQNGNFDVNVSINEEDKYFYYRSYIKLKSGSVFYGEIKNYTKEDDPLKKALIQLYNSTGGDKWTHKDNWCSDKPVTEWYGVSYDELDDTYYIELRENNLTGKINQTFPENLKIHLACDNNKLSSVNIINCTSLVSLCCNNNQLNFLDFSGCNSLEDLACEENQLTSLNIWGCDSLKYLFCAFNQLSSLNVSNCLSLRTLNCFNNPLTSLKVSNTSISELSCQGTQLNVVDVSNCKKLKDLNLSYIESNSLKIIGKGTPINNLSCAYGQVSSLDVSNCNKLKDLYCNYNNLKSLNVSGCISLTNLNCSYNQLTSLDVSTCTSLVVLGCSNNKLSSVIDVYNCTSLTLLGCENNNIKSAIPEYYSRFDFLHDVRYRYWRDKYGKIQYEDTGNGWWYPGEPESGIHYPQ